MECAQDLTGAHLRGSHAHAMDIKRKLMQNDGGIVNSVKAVRPFVKPEPLTDAELDRPLNREQHIVVTLCGYVLAQREMEKRRSPLVSIPPFGRGFSRHGGLSSDDFLPSKCNAGEWLPRC